MNIKIHDENKQFCAPLPIPQSEPPLPPPVWADDSISCCIALVLGLSYLILQSWSCVSWIPCLLSCLFLYFAKVYPVVDLHERVLGRYYLSP